MRDVWWQFQRPRLKLYKEIHRLGIAWLISATSETFAFVGIPVSADHPIVFSHAVNVLTLESVGEFAVLQSSLHSTWARRYGGSLKQDFRYTTTDCLENFPFPEITPELDDIGDYFHSHRAHLMQTLEMGLTALAGAFNLREERSLDELRDLQRELDTRALRAYGGAFDLDHGFYETKQGARFTISQQARAKVLDLLLALNHERYAAEQRVAEATPKPKASKRKPKPAADAPLLEFL